MNREMIKALEADGEKLRQLTGEDHGPFLIGHDFERLRYVPCEHCHGTGEIIHGIPPRHAYDEPSDYAVLCSACEGYGMECVETEPVTMADLDDDQSAN